MVRVTAVSDVATAVLLGGAMAAGIVCILAAAPRWRAASLTRRIAPYLRDVVEDASMPAWVLPQVGILPSSATSGLARARDAVLRAFGDPESLRRRLAQAGSTQEAVAFRARQLGWAVAGVVIGAALVIVLALTERMTPPALALPVVLGAAGAVGADLLLSAQVRARTSRLNDELPTTLEFLALCLSAGEGFLDALRRVAGVGSGELTQELRHVVLAVGTGSSLVDALTEMAQRVQVPGISRAVDQVVAALEHGAPLAGVLHAQASDAREDAKRGLIEQAGRREIFMMMPQTIAKRCYRWMTVT